MNFRTHNFQIRILSQVTASLNLGLNEYFDDNDVPLGNFWNHEIDVWNCLHEERKCICPK